MSDRDQDGSETKPGGLDATQWFIVAASLNHALRETLLALGPQLGPHAETQLVRLRDELIESIRNAPLAEIPLPGETAAIEQAVSWIRFTFDGKPERE